MIKDPQSGFSTDHRCRGLKLLHCTWCWGALHLPWEQTRKSEVRERLASFENLSCFSWGILSPQRARILLAGEAEAVLAEEIKGRDTVSDHKHKYLEQADPLAQDNGRQQRPGEAGTPRMFQGDVRAELERRSLKPRPGCFSHARSHCHQICPKSGVSTNKLQACSLQPLSSPMMGLRGVHSGQGPTWEGAPNRAQPCPGREADVEDWGPQPRPPSSSAQNVTERMVKGVSAGRWQPCLWLRHSWQQRQQLTEGSVRSWGGTRSNGGLPSQQLASLLLAPSLGFLSSEKKWDLERGREGREGKGRRGRRGKRTGHPQALNPEWDCGLLSLLQFWLYIKDTPSNTNKRSENQASCVLEIPGRLHGGGETGAEGCWNELTLQIFKQRRPRGICHLQTWTEETVQTEGNHSTVGTQIFQKGMRNIRDDKKFWVNIIKVFFSS